MYHLRTLSLCFSYEHHVDVGCVWIEKLFKIAFSSIISTFPLFDVYMYEVVSNFLYIIVSFTGINVENTAFVELIS